MAILVTGGAGYIGSHTVLALIDAGFQPVVLDDLSTGVRKAIPAGVAFVQGDVGDAALLSDVLSSQRIETVIHFAGSISVPESINDPLSYYRNNTIKSHALISACVRHGIRNFIFSSTAAIYGEAGELPIGEDTPPHPINPYGWSKLMTERILLDAGATQNLSSVIFRYFNVAGADPQGRIGQSGPDASHLIRTAIQTALGVREEMAIFGTDYPTADGTCVRDFIHVSDLAAAHVLALRYLLSGGKSTILNCGYGHGYTVRDVLNTVRRLSNRSFKIVDAARRAGDLPIVVSRAELIRQVLNWQPQHDNLDTIVRTAMDWEKTLIRT
jgi:UDP-glucose 4-epimerase